MQGQFMAAQNDWNEYSKLVMSHLERHEEWLKSISTAMQQLAIAVQKWEDNQERITELELRVHKLETDRIKREAVTKYRTRLAAGGAGVVGAAALEIFQKIIS